MKRSRSSGQRGGGSGDKCHTEQTVPHLRLLALNQDVDGHAIPLKEKRHQGGRATHVIAPHELRRILLMVAAGGGLRLLVNGEAAWAPLPQRLHPQVRLASQLCEWRDPARVAEIREAIQDPAGNAERDGRWGRGGKPSFRGGWQTRSTVSSKRRRGNMRRSAESERLPKLNVRSWSLEASGQSNSGVEVAVESLEQLALAPSSGVQREDSLILELGILRSEPRKNTQETL
ncbi:unnamed protein product [Ectocarpus sp. CCAP 1310/34]|nr:unnamed protein product [Ectocarpus sp. CCAP 1310/34]